MKCEQCGDEMPDRVRARFCSIKCQRKARDIRDRAINAAIREKHKLPATKEKVTWKK